MIVCYVCVLPQPENKFKMSFCFFEESYTWYIQVYILWTAQDVYVLWSTLKLLILFTTKGGNVPWVTKMLHGTVALTNSSRWSNQYISYVAFVRNCERILIKTDKILHKMFNEDRKVWKSNCIVLAVVWKSLDEWKPTYQGHYTKDVMSRTLCQGHYVKATMLLVDWKP